MIDIISVDDSGMDVLDTQVQKAENALAVQRGSLDYAPDFGVDIGYFLTEAIRFQDESFKAYLVQVLANNSINVESLTEVMSALSTAYNINLTKEESSTSFISG